MRSITDNTGEYEHNWIDRLVEQVRPRAEAVIEAAEVIPQEDGSVDYKVDGLRLGVRALRVCTPGDWRLGCP